MPVFVLLMLIVGFMVLVVLTSDRPRGDEARRPATTGDTGVQREDDVVV